ncbi:MAG: aminodeoxychorismate synthase component I [Candidatus Eisenbacteria bacterium]|nr:aminodeoxychorismate synthase component I [Candidatus Eisenbacteria bacterium]
MNEGSCAFHDAESGEWAVFRDPIRIVEARSIDEILPALRLVERSVEEEGLAAAGYLSYEASTAFDPGLRTRGPSRFPLLRFGIYPRVEVLDRPPAAGREAFAAGPWVPEVERSEYDRAIARVKDRLERGDTYQVNYTMRLRAPFRGDDYSFFLALAASQGEAYAAYIDAGSFAVCSASPELFFRLEGERILARPMKGTAPRGRVFAEDEERAARLRGSEKERAENVMIVDMVRNDLGKIAVPGSVQTTRLFDAEKYPTVWQMTSTVEAETRASVAEILSALFPSASVTGAPKRSTMRIIAEIERSPREVYTGSIGFLRPGRRALFNVAIRTALVDRTRNEAEYGAGGGIVWDSTATAEHEECLAKARILFEESPSFSLLETLLRTEEGWFLLDRHMERMRESAAYFGFPFDEARIRRELERFPFDPGAGPIRARLLLGAGGETAIERGPLSRDSSPALLGLAQEPVDPENRFLYHKTTHRAIYDRARASCPACDEVLLWNTRGEATESCAANLVAEREGRLVTPPVASGLLPGTFRADLLACGTVVEERVLLEELPRATRLWLVNSVRKWREARLSENALRRVRAGVPVSG